MDRRVAVTLAVTLSALLLSGCGPSATPSPAVGPAATDTSPSATTPPTVVATPTPTAPPTPSPSPTPSPTPTPEPTPSPTPTPEPTPPTAEVFWAKVAEAVAERGRLRVRVIGPSPGELRYQPDRSATAIDGQVVFVCVGDRAWDGQAGFDQLPGSWSCGTDALVRGFRTTGAPLDAWSKEVPADRGINEEVAIADGVWRWTYTATSPTAGGDVLTIIEVDPATGEIRSAARSDPTGDTTYGISYTDAFPAISEP